jgi:hypothetical protein
MKLDYPPAIRQLANKADMYHYKQVTTWQEIAQRNLPDDYFQEFLFRRAADAIAHEFAKKVYNHTYIQRYEAPEGVVLKLDAVALSYRELVELLYQAYAEGQSDGMSRNFQMPPFIMDKQ